MDLRVLKYKNMYVHCESTEIIVVLAKPVLHNKPLTVR